MTAQEMFNSPWAHFTIHEQELILLAFEVYLTTRKWPMQSMIAEETFQSLANSLRELVELQHELNERRIERARASQSWTPEDAAGQGASDPVSAT